MLFCVYYNIYIKVERLDLFVYYEYIYRVNCRHAFRSIQQTFIDHILTSDNKMYMSNRNNPFMSGDYYLKETALLPMRPLAGSYSVVRSQPRCCFPGHLRYLKLGCDPSMSPLSCLAVSVC